MRLKVGAMVVIIGLAATSATAETITYNYDALGRLVSVSRSGGITNGQQSNYTYDIADNRLAVLKTGGPSRVVVVPLSGLKTIPFLDP